MSPAADNQHAKPAAETAPDADPVDTLEVVAERALAAYRGAQQEIERLRATETESRVRLAKTISHAKQAIRAYRESQAKLKSVEADMKEAESDLEAAEAARAEAVARAEAAEEKAAATEAKLADIRRAAAEANDRLASGELEPATDRRPEPDREPDPDPSRAQVPQPPQQADAPAPHANGNGRPHRERSPKAIQKIEGRLKRIGSDATRGARRGAA